MRVDFFFDPICPWCWITSRWIAEVETHEPIEIHWRSFSLQLKNPDAPEQYREAVTLGHRALRVIEAVRADDESKVGPLYTALGRRIHHRKDRSFTIPEVLDECGLAQGFAAAADDVTWDAVIEQSMDEVIGVVGDDIGVPTIVFDGKRGYFGPVVSPAPTGAAALDLWRVVVQLSQIPGFFELKRGRSEPEFGPEP